MQARIVEEVDLAAEWEVIAAPVSDVVELWICGGQAQLYAAEARHLARELLQAADIIQQQPGPGRVQAEKK